MHLYGNLKEGGVARTRSSIHSFEEHSSPNRPRQRRFGSLLPPSLTLLPSPLYSSGSAIRACFHVAVEA
jgi:hypothetical protein